MGNGRDLMKTKVIYNFQFRAIGSYKNVINFMNILFSTN